MSSSSLLIWSLLKYSAIIAWVANGLLSIDAEARRVMHSVAPRQREVGQEEKGERVLSSNEMKIDLKPGHVIVLNATAQAGLLLGAGAVLESS